MHEVVELVELELDEELLCLKCKCPEMIKESKFIYLECVSTVELMTKS